MSWSSLLAPPVRTHCIKLGKMSLTDRRICVDRILHGPAGKIQAEV